jgi:hypothetical protein
MHDVQGDERQLQNHGERTLEFRLMNGTLAKTFLAQRDEGEGTAVG